MASKCRCRDFPGGPVVKTPCSQCRGHRFDSPIRELDSTCHNGVARKIINKTPKKKKCRCTLDASWKMSRIWTHGEEWSEWNNTQPGCLKRRKNESNSKTGEERPREGKLTTNRSPAKFIQTQPLYFQPKFPLRTDFNFWKFWSKSMPDICKQQGKIFKMTNFQI